MLFLAPLAFLLPLGRALLVAVVGARRLGALVVRAAPQLQHHRRAVRGHVVLVGRSRGFVFSVVAQAQVFGGW